ncbi:hypothetical protein EMGBD3_02900 [Nitrosarchaeum sp.]|nr:hypothetical protein EMGBD3_02900 [Nitrosarchaeum sp.]
MSQYNLIIIRKKLYYKIYQILFSIVRKYHNLRMKQNKYKKDKTISNTTLG